MQDAIGSSNYGYDAAHRLISQTDASGFTVGYGYDEAGNVISVTYPESKTVSYTYDALNRLKTVTNWLGQTATYYYDDAGRLTSLVNFNDTVTTYSYDNANRLLSLSNKKSDTSVIASYSFTLDGNGNRTQTMQNEPLTLMPSTSTVSYTYNPQKNRLLTAGANSFSYDDEGQLSTSVIVSLSNYTFDYEHRLKTIGSNIQFFYDGAGRRLKAVRSGVETRYIYDASGNLLAEADASNNITKYYIQGLGLMAMVTDTGQVYTYHFNAVGSTIAMTDSSQNIVNKYSYDEFGNVANQVEAIAQPFKFVGQYGVMTEPNGFYYMRARYYDPSVGRFISEDPIGFEGGINLYAYASNNPLLLIDPLGKKESNIFSPGFDSNSPFKGPGNLGVDLEVDWSAFKPTDTGKVIGGIALQFSSYFLMGTAGLVVSIEGPLALVDPGIGGMAYIGGFAWWQGTKLIYEGYSELPTSQ